MGTDQKTPLGGDGPDEGDLTLGLPGPAERQPKRHVVEETHVNDDDEDDS